jgi:hypothetical protein
MFLTDLSGILCRRVMPLSSLHMILIEISIKWVIIYLRNHIKMFPNFLNFSWFGWIFVKMAPRCVIAWLYKCLDHRRGKCPTSYRGAKVFLTTVLIRICNLGEIWYQSLFTILGRIRELSWISTMGRPCLIFGSILTYIHACVMIPQDYFTQ